MIRATYIKHPMKFVSPAGTSRGVLTEKDSWFIVLSDTDIPSVSGIGECSLIPGLSFDDYEDFESRLDYACRLINIGEMPVDHPLPDEPSIRFGLETALLDLHTGGQRILFPSDFTCGKIGIPVNGLIWMGSRQSMLQQISEKIDQGFSVLKMKVGAINFEDELEILHSVRTGFDRSGLEIRLDANGAWEPDEALEKLDRLSEYHIHSIEQPIKRGNTGEMARICRLSPVDIALDEELIGVADDRNRRILLESVRPAYVVLKPGLLGGLAEAENWRKVAEEFGIGWWITSALESNIGLNAIAQWTATLGSELPQGLGTGLLFSNNIPSPLAIKGNRLWYLPDKPWDISEIML